MMDKSKQQLEESARLIYTVKEIAEILQINNRETYYILNDTASFRVIRFGRNIRIDKTTFDEWFHGEECGPMETYTPEQIAAFLGVTPNTARKTLKGIKEIRILHCSEKIMRVHKYSFDRWYGRMS